MRRSTKETKPKPGSRLALAYLSGAFGLAMSAQISFLVPLYARDLGASFEVIGFIVGSGALAAALASVSSGAVIDRFGPRNAFILGAATTALLSLVFLLVTSYWWMFLLQPVLGMARNLGWVASQGYITSVGTTEQRPKLTGRFSFFSSAGQMAGPVLVGAAAQVAGFRSAFLVLAVYALIFVILGLSLPETRAPDHAETRKAQGVGVRSALELVALRGIQVALLLTFARLWIGHVYSTFLPVYLVDTGLSPGVVGTIMATSGLVAALMAPTAGTWTRFASQETAAVLGSSFGAVALLLAPHVAVLPIIYVVPALVGISHGLSLPLLLSIVTTAAPADKRGVALGLRGMVNQTAATAAPVLVGPLIGALGIVLGFTTGGIVAAGMLLAAQLLHGSNRKPAAAARR